jgi:uncharacterized protein
VSAAARPRRPATASGPSSPEAPPAPPTAAPASDRPRERRPFLLDFFPLETPDQTRLSAFFDHLKEGRLTTTRCRRDAMLLWPPRTTCPKCHTDELDWVDLPADGRIYAFSAVLGGAPLGMEDEVPFAVGLVDLDGASLRLFGRIDGKPWPELRVGDRVRVEPYDVGDGRFFYRFRVAE